MWFTCLTDKFFTNPKLSLINVPALNYLLRSEIFVNDDGQLRAVHLILDFEPISRSFLDVGNSIRAGDYRLACIDVYKNASYYPLESDVYLIFIYFILTHNHQILKYI